MVCGTAVVASNVPSLVEAVGEAAELVSPDNVFDIARGMREVLLNEERRRWPWWRPAKAASNDFIGRTPREKVWPFIVKRQTLNLILRDK